MMKSLFLVCFSFVSFALYGQKCALPSCEPHPSMQRGDVGLEGLSTGCKFPAAYNQPGNIAGEEAPDIYITGSYLYWCVQEDGLNLATTAYVYQNMLGFIVPSERGGYALFPDTKYSSGFKVGVGANVGSDDWVFDIEGTRFCQTTHSKSKPAPLTTEGTGVFKLSGWFYESAVTQDVVANQVLSKWELELDWLDVMMKRPYYQGKRLVVIPSLGLRGSRVWQELKVVGIGAFGAEEQLTPVNDTSKNYSHSWAVGPRALVDSRWILGAGIRLQGNIGASLLFTQFSKVFHKESGTALLPVNFQLNHYNCLRPMMEANLGLGWGTYLNYDTRHLDISATFDFNYLWGQNMLKYISEINSTGNGSAIGDLFLYGLTVKGRFDF